MKVHVEIDPNCEEPEIIVRTCELTDELSKVIQKISASGHRIITGFSNDEAYLLEPTHLIRVYSADKKIYAETMEAEFTLRMRLYELEKCLDPNRFVRISNSEIVNLKAIKKMDLSFTGTIAMTLSNGKTTYVSRRYVGKIKKTLRI